MPKRYTSNVTDSQWALVKEYFETDPAVGGRPRRHSARTLLDAIFYVMRTGCSWRDLPGAFRRGKRSGGQGSAGTIGESCNAPSRRSRALEHERWGHRLDFHRVRLRWTWELAKRL
jgi:transposase